MDVDIQTGKDGSGDLDRAARALPLGLSESQFKRSLAMHRFTSTRLSKGANSKAHVESMGELLQDVLEAGAYTSQDTDASSSQRTLTPCLYSGP